jgi:gluconokinase
MGVAGSGKTTVGEKLAAQLGWQFRDADAFHPAANIAKMATGVPLTDDDRLPWLQAIRAYLDDCAARGERSVVTCSALRESYRRVLLAGRSDIRLVFLAGNFDLILGRVAHRVGHFMKADMLESQFAALEAPQNALTIDVAQSPDAIVAEIRTELSL